MALVCSSLRVRPERIRVHWTNGSRFRCPPAYDGELLCAQDTLNVEMDKQFTQCFSSVISSAILDVCLIAAAVWSRGALLPLVC